MASRVLLLLGALLLLSLSVRSDDEEEKVLTGINSYRAALNLSALTENDNAECLADQIAEEFKNQPCTNSSGANTVPGTEDQFPNYPKYLSHCHLNITNTRDGVIMPVCVPGLASSAVLANYTQSQYNKFLNDSQYTGAGIASEDDWMVVVLSTSTPAGSFVKADSSDSVRAAGWGLGLLSLVVVAMMVTL
ncbi:hypothetical protein H6P81_002458 [Aristolochia fimbriata]|uniref:Uncharacterized GPI-anchored protein At5g19230-like domain-containing protein n=1 Tax=Aristolochia fimbriata TaxID=158543 RepID=A0AAV7F9U5_ARIFI|nr:hypothetical protein H6P81_002458 [Aristolochia fimbriata]